MAAHQDEYMSAAIAQANQASFTTTFDLSNPSKAASDYARLMHTHTRHQYESVAPGGNDPRRSPIGNDVPTLNSEPSNASNESNESSTSVSPVS